MSHFIIKCERCNKVISQCRCIDKNKPVRYQMCDDCAKGTTPSHGEKENV